MGTIVSVQVDPSAREHQGLRIPFVEIGVRDGSSPEWAFDDEEQYARRKFFIRWDDIGKAPAQALGFSWRDTGSTIGADSLGVDGATANRTLYRIRRWLPEFDANFPLLMCDKVIRMNGYAWEKQGTATGADEVMSNFGVRKCNAYKVAQLELQYRAYNMAILDDNEVELASAPNWGQGEFPRYVEKDAQPSAEVLTYPEGACIYHSSNSGPAGGKPFPGQPARLVVQYDVSYLWRGVPNDSVPWNGIESRLGCTNSTQFDNHAPHTLLFLGTVMERKRQLLGEVAPTPTAAGGGTGDNRWDYKWNIKYLFKKSPQGPVAFFDWRNAEAAGTGGLGTGPPTRPKGFFYVVFKDTNKTYVLTAGSVADGVMAVNERDFYRLFKGE